MAMIHQRSDHCACRRAIPRTSGQIHKAVLEVIDDHRLSNVLGFVERPNRIEVFHVHNPGCRRVFRVDAGSGNQASMTSTALNQINQGEGEIVRIALDARRCRRTDFFRHVRPRCPGGYVAQQLQATLSKNSRSLVPDDAEDYAHGAAFIANRTESEGEVGPLGIAISLHDKEQCFIQGRLATLKDCPHAWTDYVPHLRPYFANRSAKRFRMLLAEEWTIGVIVEIDKIAAPKYQHGVR